jgi:hypothetical protein
LEWTRGRIRSRRSTGDSVSRTQGPGAVYDLGIPYDRSSYKWPGHNPGEVISFRTPEGVKRQQDLPVADNPSGTAWHSCVLFISDQVYEFCYVCTTNKIKGSTAGFALRPIALR